MPTETRTYVGIPDKPAFQGFAGYHVGEPYELSYTKEFDKVRITRPQPLELSAELFERLFRYEEPAEWKPEPDAPLLPEGESWLW